MSDSRLRRFVQLYGWRAYAVPVLAVATLLTLVDVAGQESSAEQSAARSSASARSSVTTAAAPTSSAAPAPTPTATGGEPERSAPAPTGTAPAPTETAPGTQFVQRGEGTLRVVPGGSEVLGIGPLLRFRVEVENGIDLDGRAFAAEVEATLTDPRGWGADGRRSFQRVSDGPYDFRVALVSPDNVNSFCPGLDTGGYTSCRSGDRAVINLARWLDAVPDYEGDVATYRQYVVNHEVGHFLGNSHEQCPGQGELAPVMQQQTLGLDGCVKNPWPYPRAG